MENPAYYWQLVRLTSAGTCQFQEYPALKTLITDARQVALSPQLDDPDATAARRALIGNLCGIEAP